MGRSDTIPLQFRQVALRYPDRPAVIDGETQYTYADLLRLSGTYAKFLQESLGLSAGQIILASLDNCAEFVASFLASAEIGAVFFPLDTNLRPPELRWFLDRLPVAGVVTRQALCDPWNTLADRIPPERLVSVDDPRICSRLPADPDAESPPEALTPPSPDQLAVYFSSSGSTGVPKVVPRSHSNMVEGAAGTARALDIEPGLRFMSVVPFYHGNGFDNSLCLPLFSGATAVLQSEFVPSRFAEAVAALRIQVLVGSPAIFELLVRFEVDADCLSTLEICASSGGPVAPDIVDAIRERFGKNIRQVYGSSETGVIAIEPAELGRPAVPVHSASIRIVDPDGQSLPEGEDGEITVGGPPVASGYVGDHDLTAAAFRDGYFHTGDRGHLDSAGELTLTGRIRPVINLSGTKVDPVEIENVLLNLPGVSACRTFAEQVQPGRQVVKAVIAVREGETLTRADVIEHCRRFLAEYKIPRLVELVPALPPSLTGKRITPWTGTANAGGLVS